MKKEEKDIRYCLRYHCKRCPKQRKCEEMINIEDKSMEETIKYISFKVFCNNAIEIKNYFYKLSREEKSQFRKWIYGNAVLREYLKDLIWQYIMGDINRTQLNRGR